jgi:outer membrane lipoprotein LolB
MMNKAVRFIGAVLFLSMLLWVSGCSTLTQTRPEPEAAVGSKPEVAQIPEHWSMQGRIGVMQGEEGWHGKLDWQQDLDDFSIRIRGPFGAEQAELRRLKDKLELRAPGGQSISGARLAAWEREVFGTALPVEALPYWLHGKPYPGMKLEMKRDRQGQAREIRQSGWRVDYRDWIKRSGNAMPGKITLNKGKVRIKLIVNDYRKKA